MSPRVNVAASANAQAMRFIACCALSVACVGLQYDESTGAGGGQAGASTGGGSNGGGGEAAGGEGGANFVVPSGWTGPVQVGEACNADPNSLEVVTSFSGESTCSCACTVGECQPYVDKSTVACDSILDTVIVTVMEQCVTVADVPTARVEIQNTSCSAQASLPGISSESVRVCSAPQGDCIYTEESATCPEGFPNPGPTGVLSLADTRTCGACSCDVQQCELMANVANPDCTQLGFAIQEGGCLGGFDAVRVAWQPATCTTDGPVPASGSVAGVDPISVCCR